MAYTNHGSFAAAAISRSFAFLSAHMIRLMLIARGIVLAVAIFVAVFVTVGMIVLVPVFIAVAILGGAMRGTRRATTSGADTELLSGTPAPLRPFVGARERRLSRQGQCE